MRLVSLTGATSVSHPDHGSVEAGADGVFDVPHEFAEALLKMKAHWRTEYDHLAVKAREAVQELRNPRKAAEVLAAVRGEVDALRARVAELEAELRKAPAKKAPAKKAV